ncbi:hypothetical protein L0Y59_03950, partial [Candidatus Uhrbacteria bacterium]|nr:hypothetical protein [Candidatus Uhrbacteria bacterium]
MYVTVVPAIRTPLGVDAFDYRADDGADLRVGDVIRVPFRKQDVPALIVKTSSNSAFADKTLDIGVPAHLLRLPPGIVRLLEVSARHVFVSRPTVLH